MAIKDPNVLNRVNTLNTNLENANSAEIERNLSSRLFNVLEGANSISVDSELYASIDNVTRASDLDNFINRNKNDLPHTTADQIQINYAGGTYNVANTTVNLTPTDGITETQNAINDIRNAITGLNNLPGQISTLRTRLEENRRILNQIHNTQSNPRRTTTTIADLNTAIANDTGNRDRCSNLLSILSRIQSAEQHVAYSNPAHAQHAYYTTLHTNEVANYNASIGGITGLHNYNADGQFVMRSAEVRTAQTNYDNNIRNLQQQLRLSEEAASNMNHLPTSNIRVPADLGLFNTNDTVVNTATLTDAPHTQDQIDDIDRRLEQLEILEGQIENLRTRYEDNLNRLNRILSLQQLQQRMNTTHPGEMERRQHEFDTIREISHNNLWLGEGAPGTYEPYLPNNTIRVGERGIGTNPARLIHLNFINGNLGTGFNGGARNFSYSLCDNTGKQLRNNGGRFEVQLEGGQTVNISGIQFDNTNQTMSMNNVEINPIEGITFPLNLDLNVMVRIHDEDTGLDINHHKPIHLEITSPTLNQTTRENAYDTLVPPMNDRIQAEYSDYYRESLENDAIWEIVRAGGNEAEINEIYNNETKRDMFINRVRTALVGSFPFLALADLQTGFRTDMTRMDRNIPPQYLMNDVSFQNYLRQSIPENLKTYASREIHNNMEAHRNEIINEFLTMQADIANSPKDNFDNLRALSAVPNDAHGPQSHPNNFWQRLTGETSRKNNYTKFFTGREATLDNQTLETENGTIKYGVHVKVSGNNRITATINIDGKDEPEIIDAANHDRLIRGILNRANTKDGEPLNRKLRCNIALSVLKAMVLMSPMTLKRNLRAPLTFGDGRGGRVTCDRIEADIHEGNLRIRGATVDPAANLGTPNPTGRTRRNVTIFNEESFKNLHDLDQLRDGILQLSVQINSIMNATAAEYNDATSSILSDAENRRLMRYNTGQRLRGGPIKRLRGRIAYGKTSRNFDFETSVSEAGKSTNISFNKGLFTISGEFDGQHYEYKARDLGYILRKKINRKRVFDGIELAMLAAINEEYINKLRTNNLVQSENFAVADTDENKTGRIYIFDDGGNLSYLDIEDRNLNPLGGENVGRIDADAIPAERIRCNDQERKEFFQNPLLAGRLLREMRRRLALF